MNSFKTVVVTILNLIHQKLKTKEGQLSLIIIASLITGAAIVTAHLKAERITELTNDRKDAQQELAETEKLVEQLRLDLKNADSDCNNKILEGAIFQKKLKDIFEDKTELNEEIIEAKVPLIKEKEKVIKTQKKNLSDLKKLNNKL